MLVSVIIKMNLQIILSSHPAADEEAQQRGGAVTRDGLEERGNTGGEGKGGRVNI